MAVVNATVSVVVGVVEVVLVFVSFTKLATCPRKVTVVEGGFGRVFCGMVVVA